MTTETKSSPIQTLVAELRERSEDVAAAKLTELEECLKSVAYQYGVIVHGQLSSGFLSAMEEVFEQLGWDDPCPAPDHMICDEPGCLKAVSSGWPSDKGYRHTCSDHYTS